MNNFEFANPVKVVFGKGTIDVYKRQGVYRPGDNRSFCNAFAQLGHFYFKCSHNIINFYLFVYRRMNKSNGRVRVYSIVIMEQGKEGESSILQGVSIENPVYVCIFFIP